MLAAVRASTPAAASGLVVALALAAGPAAGQGVQAILEPAQFAEIRPPVAGRLGAVAVTEGDRVSEGDVLASMDASVQEARVALARTAAEAGGALSRAERALEQARDAMARVERARAQGAAQGWEVDRARHAVALAEAEGDVARDGAARARAELALEEATLARLHVRAPFDATVLQVLREPGESVGADEALMELARLDALEATAFVPVGWLGAVAPGDVVRARTEGGEGVALRLRWIDPRVDAASRTIRATLELPNEAGRFLAGTAVALEAP